MKEPQTSLVIEKRNRNIGHMRELQAHSEIYPSAERLEIGIRSINKPFLVGVSWKNKLIEIVQEEILNELSKAPLNEERKEIPKNKLPANGFAETIDFNLAFTCRGCGDRLTLNDFQLSDNF